MITDRDLDIQLTGAAGVRDADLPALPDDFLHDLIGARAGESASVIAARQLVADAHDARRAGHSRGRRPGRRTVVRVGAAVVAVAAAWAAAVLVTPADRPASRDDVATPTQVTPGPGETPADGIRLVAADAVAFPFSLDPAPVGLTPDFSMRGGMAYYGDGPVVFVANYSSDDGRVLIDLFPSDPRELPEMGWSVSGEPAGTVTVNGIDAQLTQGEGSSTLLWERPDGRWTWILGEGSYGDPEAVVAVAESIVDRPQPVGLQFGLAPEGWSLGGYEESRSLDLVSDADPSQPPLRVSLFGGPGYEVTIDDPFDGRVLAGPVEPVTIKGLPARMAIAEDSDDMWLVTGQLPGGPLFLMLAPPILTRDQVLQIAEEISYTG